MLYNFYLKYFFVFLLFIEIITQINNHRNNQLYIAFLFSNTCILFHAYVHYQYRCIFNFINDRYYILNK